MKYSMLALVVLFLSVDAFAGPKEVAIDHFVKLQKAGTNKELATQIKKQEDNNLKREDTDAIFLTGGCGCIGCVDDFLVLTYFKGSPPMSMGYGTNSVAAMVRVASNHGGSDARVESTRVLSAKDYEALVRP